MNIESREPQLIDDILSGDHEKYRLLVDRYAPLVFSVVRRFESDPDEIQELGQQIFVKAYEKLDQFKKRSKFSSWLYMLAKNHCRDYADNIRRQNLRFSEMENKEVEQNLGQGDSAEYRIQNIEWKQLLDRALNSISEDHATAFLMKYQDGMTYQVMAERLDVTVSALKVRVHRARKELKQFIETNT